MSPLNPNVSFRVNLPQGADQKTTSGRISILVGDKEIAHVKGELTKETPSKHPRLAAIFSKILNFFPTRYIKIQDKDGNLYEVNLGSLSKRLGISKADLLKARDSHTLLQNVTKKATEKATSILNPNTTPVPPKDAPKSSVLMEEASQPLQPPLENLVPEEPKRADDPGDLKAAAEPEDSKPVADVGKEITPEQKAAGLKLLRLKKVLALEKQGVDVKTPLYFAIGNIRKLPKEEIAAGKHDLYIEACLKRALIKKDVESIRWLASVISSKKHVIPVLMQESVENLKKALADPDDTVAIEKAFSEFYNKWKTRSKDVDEAEKKFKTKLDAFEKMMASTGQSEEDLEKKEGRLFFINKAAKNSDEVIQIAQIVFKNEEGGARLIAQLIDYSTQIDYIRLGTLLANSYKAYNEVKKAGGDVSAIDISIPKEKKFWGEGIVDPESYVEISHGGGLSYIQRFFKNEEKGYVVSDVEGHGLFVSANTNTRDDDYALRVAEGGFDVPAKFTGRIKAKYLAAVQNGYEAVLRPEMVKHIEGLEISVVEPKTDV